MTVEELIRVLSAYRPDATVDVRWNCDQLDRSVTEVVGYEESYRGKFAWVTLGVS